MILDGVDIRKLGSAIVLDDGVEQNVLDGVEQKAFEGVEQNVSVGPQSAEQANGLLITPCAL